MRWIAFIIVLYLIAVAQSTVAPFAAIQGVVPNLMVIFAVHYILAARPIDAALACWCIGFAIDLTTMSFAGYSNVGVHSFCLGLIGFVAVRLRELTFRDSPFAQCLFAFGVMVAIAFLSGLHAAWVLGRWSVWWQVFTLGFWQAVYTGMLAPYGLWILNRMRGLLGVGVPSRVRVG